MQTTEYFYLIGFLYIAECLRIIYKWGWPDREHKIRNESPPTGMEVFQIGTEEIARPKNKLQYIVDMVLFIWVFAGYFMHLPEKTLFGSLGLFLVFWILYFGFAGQILLRGQKLPISIRQSAIIKDGTELIIVSLILIQHYFFRV